MALQKTSTQNRTLAIAGGPRAVPEGLIQKWPPVDDVDRQMVLDSLEGGKHAFGPNCKAFQEEFAQWNGNQFAINTNSGTAALHMGIVAAGCNAGDEVIVAAYSWSSSATSILHHNCVPVFVDIDFDTMNIDVDKIEAAITAKTKAIVVVHLHGLAVDMERVMDLARRNNLKVVEDACQSHGALFKGRKVGTWGDCAAFSFNQNKCLCSGEGGMFVTDSEQMYEDAKSLWSFGETRTPAEDRDYHVYAMGWMYRPNDMTAAFGRAQLSKLDGYIETQKENARIFADCLQDVPHLILPSEPEGHEHIWYNYTIRFDMEELGHKADAADFRGKLLQALKAEGVQTAVWQAFILPAMTVFQAKNGYGHGCPWDCPHAQPVDYSVEQYPMAQKHAVSHTGLTVPLRAPNGREAVEATAAGIRKVMENIAQVEDVELT